MTVGGAMRSDVGRELKRLEEENGVEVSAVISRNGVPIAWNMLGMEHLDAFAALSATIIGATEVVYADLGKDPPKLIVIESGDGTFVAAPIGGQAFLVFMCKNNGGNGLCATVDRAVAAVRRALAIAGFAV